MASNPTIDAVPHHLRDTSNPTAQIQRYLAGQRPFLQEFIVRGREHIDRALKRDERRAELKRERERQGRGTEIGEGSSSWEGSTVTGLASSSSRSSGIVRRMRRKDGSCLQENGQSGSSSNRKHLGGGKGDQALQGTDTIVVDVLKRSEFRALHRRSGVQRELEDIHEETDRDKENVDRYLAVEAGKKPSSNALAGTTTVKDKQPLRPFTKDKDKEKTRLKEPENEMITDLPVRSRARPVLVDKTLNVKEDKNKDTMPLGGKKRKKGVGDTVEDKDVGKDGDIGMDVDGESMTSSAKRRHERKLRRRAKAAIRHTPSRPPDDQVVVDEDDEEEEVGSTIEVLPATGTSKRRTTTSTNKDAGKAKNGNDIATITKPTTATPATTTMNANTMTIRKRKGNVGLNMMANFKSDSLAKGRRMTLAGGRTGMFLGGRKVSSSWRNVAGEGRGIGAGNEIGLMAGTMQREPSSSPPSKIRRVESPKPAASETSPVLEVTKAVATAAVDGVRRSKRLSEKNGSPGSVDRQESESEASSTSSSSSGTRSRSSYSRKLAAGRRREKPVDKLTLEPEREQEMDLEWSVSSPGRGRNVSKAKALVDRETSSSQQEPGMTATGIEIGVEAEMDHPRPPRSTTTTGREAGPSFGLRSNSRSKLGSSFHVRTDTPISKQSRSQYRLPAQSFNRDEKVQKNMSSNVIGKGSSSTYTDKENEHKQDVTGDETRGGHQDRRALRSIRLAGADQKNGNPREKNWFRPPKSRNRRTGMQDDVDEPENRPAVGLGRQRIQDMCIGAEGDEPAEAFVWGTNVFGQGGTEMGLKMGKMTGGWSYELGEEIEDGMEGWQGEDKENVGIDFGIGEAYEYGGCSVGMNEDIQEYEDGDDDGDRVGMHMGMGVGLRGAYAGYGLEGLNLDLDLDMGMDMGQDDSLYAVEHRSAGLPTYFHGGTYNEDVEEEDQDGHELQVDRLGGDGHYGFDDRQEGRCFDPMALEMDPTCDVQLDTDLNLEPEMQTMDTEDEPAIDMFGTRVSELQREIFAGGRGRW